jgi:hypothetical protein
MEEHNTFGFFNSAEIAYLVNQPKKFGVYWVNCIRVYSASDTEANFFRCENGHLFIII